MSKLTDMRRVFAIGVMFFGLSALAQDQTYPNPLPYNPDSNLDGFIGIDDLLIVSYDILTTHTFVAVKLNLDGVEAVDTGFTPPDGDEDGSGSDELPELAVDTSKSGCAVAGSSVGGLLLVLGMVSARRRRD